MARLSFFSMPSVRLMNSSGPMLFVKMTAEPPAQKALQMARDRWCHYSGSRRILLERLTFVREDIRDGTLNCWVDLASVDLGRTLVSR